MVTLEQAKHNMRIDYDDDDELIDNSIDTVTQMCTNILGGQVRDDDVLFDQAVLVGVAYLYDNRDLPNIKQLKLTLRDILVDLRGFEF